MCEIWIPIILQYLLGGLAVDQQVIGSGHVLLHAILQRLEA